MHCPNASKVSKHVILICQICFLRNPIRPDEIYNASYIVSSIQVQNVSTNSPIPHGSLSLLPKDYFTAAACHKLVNAIRTLSISTDPLLYTFPFLT